MQTAVRRRLTQKVTLSSCTPEYFPTHRVHSNPHCHPSQLTYTNQPYEFLHRTVTLNPLTTWLDKGGSPP